MAQYQVVSTNYRSFSLTIDGVSLAELIYPKWFSFKAEINFPDSSQLLLAPKGVWDGKIELKNGEVVLISFKLGWKGIMFNIQSEGQEENYLLKHKGILKSGYVLLDIHEKELLAVHSDFNWSKFKLDYTIETSDEFDPSNRKEAFLLTIIHSINYQMAMMVGAA